MNWRIKAFLQKILATTKLGDKLNHLSVTLNKKYHQNVFLYQSHECLRKFNYCKFNTNNLTVLEIGTGYSIISCVVLFLLGFKEIVTVDISNDIRYSTFKKQIAFFTNEFLTEIISKSQLNETEIRDKFSQINEAKSLSELFNVLNLTYIAPYSLEDIEKQNIPFDYISSQVVLEHVKPEILEILFQKTKNWLKKDGFCVHTINFIDHFANPGFFQDKSISEFNFLKFSDKQWSFWAKNPIAYTNRLSYIYYLQLCEKHKLQVVNFIGENYRNRKELDKNTIHKDILNKYSVVPKLEDLIKYQRGTFVIKL